MALYALLHLSRLGPSNARNVVDSITIVADPPRTQVDYAARWLMPNRRFPQNHNRAWSPAMWQAIERLTEANHYDVAHLFGSEALEPRFEISGGRFVARQRIAIVGHSGRIDGVPVVGPPGERTTISFSVGDHEKLGLDGRGLILVGPSGELKVSEPS